MPANLPPQYYEAEKKLRESKDPAEKIEIIEELLAIMPKHKGTDHLKAELRARIAKLSQSLEKRSAIHRSSTKIVKEGAGQVAVIGLPNSGKSQLVASVTNAAPAVADYPFTTQTAIPGMMPFENIQIQLIDTPPVAPDSYEFWLPHMLRRADALLIMVDLAADPATQLGIISEQLEKMRIRLGTQPEGDQAFVTYKKGLVAANKIDLAGARQAFELLLKKCGGAYTIVGISAKDGAGLEELKLRLYELLDIIRVYTKLPGRKPDMTEPIILDKGSTLEDAAAAVHKDFLARLKYARIWGSGKHDGLMVRRDHILHDGDIIELHV